jgi:deoxyribonuclease V
MMLSELTEVPDLYQMVYDLTAQVPEGKVTTYGSIAKALGDIKASRAVGTMENLNPRPIIVPCHRVVYSDGGLSGFGAPGGSTTKIKFLEREGVSVRDGMITDFESRLFTGFEAPSPAPLAKLRKLQDEMSTRVILEDSFDGEVDTVCGIDVAYRDRTAFGAASVLSLSSGKVKEEVVVECNVNFPYIPTYLAFRELTPIINALKALKADPDIVMLDGNGILHPRRFGVACHVGVALDKPVFGAAKKPLCGQYNADELCNVGDSTPMMLDDEHVGYALLSSPRSSKPIFISPGHKISSDTSLRIAKDFVGHKMLKPIKAAHELATAKAKEWDRKNQRI